MINHKENITVYEQVKSRLNTTVTKFAALSSVFVLKNKWYVTFVGQYETVWPLEFDSLSHVEIWAEHIAMYPDLVKGKFEKRLVK